MTDIDPEELPAPCFCIAVRPLLLSDSAAAPRGRSFSFHRLPQSPLKLSVLKLDGYCFDVEVSRMANVAELKEAVEQHFSQSPRERHINISWPHVWNNFCLCYKDHKLVEDKAHIRFVGIKDGDQLNFIRYVSRNYSFEKRRMKHRNRASEQLMV